MSFRSKLGKVGSAFLVIFAEVVTQILLMAVALSAIFSDQLHVRTAPFGQMSGFEGKCTLVTYTTDKGTSRTTFGCSNFLKEMSSAAFELGQTPPVAIGVNIDLFNQNMVTAIVLLLLGTAAPAFAVRSKQNVKDLATLTGTVAAVAAVVVFTHAELVSRQLTRPSIGQTAAVGDAVYVLLACSLVNLYCQKKP